MKIIGPVAVNDTELYHSNVPEDDYPAWMLATEYDLDDRVLVIDADIHRVYQSLQNGNVGHPPLADVDGEWWVLVGNDNRWKMFDGYVSSQTVMPEQLSVVLEIAPIIDSVCLLNIDAQSAVVTVTAPVDGLVYERELDLVSDSGVDDYFEYWFSPVERITDIALTDIPLYSEVVITVDLYNELGDVKCGALFVGQSRDIGSTQYGFELGRTDYSAVTTNDFGDTFITKRGNARNVNLPVKVSNTFLASVDRLLSEYLSIPAVYVGSDAYGEVTTLLAIYQDYSLLVEYQLESVLSIRLKGLI